MALEDFSDEILVYIFNFLIPSFRRIAALTCSRLYSVFGTKDLPYAGISNLSLLSWAEEMGITWKTEAFAVLAFHGHIEVLKILKVKGYSWFAEILLNAVKGNQIETVEYLLSTGCPYNSEAAEAAVRQGNLEIFKLLYTGCISTHYDPSYALFMDAVEYGSLEIVKYFIGLGYHCDMKHMRRAVYNGHLEVLKYLHQNGCPWDKRVCSISALNGHLEVLKYLHDNGCPWSKRTFDDAVRNNYPEIIKYLHKNGCPWSENTCRNATINGYLEILKYLHDNGCPWDKRVCSDAARNGHLEILKYLRDNGCPWGEESCYFAIAEGHLEVLKYLHKNGCPWNGKICGAFVRNEHVEVLKYLHENNMLN